MVSKWTPFLKKLGNPEPQGIKIQKKHEFSYTGKSIFVTITEAIWTPDTTAFACFSAIHSGTQALDPLLVQPALVVAVRAQEGHEKPWPSILVSPPRERCPRTLYAPT